MIIKECIEIFRKDTSIEDFEKEIELLKSAGYELYDEGEDYVCFYQTLNLIDSDLLINKKMGVKI